MSKAFSETHEIGSLAQKPSDDEINRMVRDFSEEGAATYNEFSAQIEKRSSYTTAIDAIIVRQIRLFGDQHCRI